MSTSKKPAPKMRLIGFIALGVCVLGYSGMALALGAGKMGYMDMVHAGLLAAGVGIVGEIGLWVGGLCLGLSFITRRKAWFDRMLGRKPRVKPSV